MDYQSLYTEFADGTDYFRTFTEGFRTFRVVRVQKEDFTGILRALRFIQERTCQKHARQV